MENFNNKMAELLEVDAVTDTDVLEQFEAWDSLTSLSIIAFFEEDYGIVISAKDLLNAKTVGGLKQLVQSKKKS